VVLWSHGLEYFTPVRINICEVIKKGKSLGDRGTMEKEARQPKEAT
jgi:hypothetical protein